MNQNRFTGWSIWDKRNDLDNTNYPGVYAIRISQKSLAGRKFSWHKEIVYIGMTNAITGLRGRLKAFDDTIGGKSVRHGGGDRFKFQHQNYDEVVEKLYVSVARFKADVTSKTPKNLRVMGDVARFEFQCLAKYVESYGELPEFNDMQKSKKHSLTYGRNNL